LRIWLLCTASSERTVRRRLAHVADSFTPSTPNSAVAIVDTTYFGRGFGVMLFQDAHTGAVLQRQYVSSETNAAYREGLDVIRSRGTVIKAVVCDGHTGLLASITECPVQMCQFHMFQIVRRKYNPQNEMFHDFETKRSKHKTKCYFSNLP